MGWFNRNKLPVEETESAHDSRVEVVVHKEATKEMIEKAKIANEHLSDILNQNGFTIKIFIAAGGKTKTRGENH